mmetsp:Transcript_26266/g.62443  ORF Transcript_26266/g.62443 Transcript_26266/m.62443 type:complete len:242 (+) Transcript_26266:340-1065(+)
MSVEDSHTSTAVDSRRCNSQRSCMSRTSSSNHQVHHHHHHHNNNTIRTNNLSRHLLKHRQRRSKWSFRHNRPTRTVESLLPNKPRINNNRHWSRPLRRTNHGLFRQLQHRLLPLLLLGVGIRLIRSLLLLLHHNPNQFLWPLHLLRLLLWPSTTALHKQTRTAAALALHLQLHLLLLLPLFLTNNRPSWNQTLHNNNRLCPRTNRSNRREGTITTPRTEEEEQQRQQLLVRLNNGTTTTGS